MTRTRLSTALRMYLAANQITQQQLAKEWKTSPATVSRLVSGESMPEGETLMRVLTWFLGRDET